MQQTPHANYIISSTEIRTCMILKEKESTNVKHFAFLHLSLFEQRAVNASDDDDVCVCAVCEWIK